MKSIVFFDTEIEPNSCKVLDIGCVKEPWAIFHSNSLSDFSRFIEGSEFICGHNIFHHDLEYIQSAVKAAGIHRSNCIDTLFLSPLLFPKKPYHALLKDDKLQTDELNNPVNDSIKARDLFFDEANAFMGLDTSMKRIFLTLLKNAEEFQGFFHFLNYEVKGLDPVDSVDPVIDMKVLTLETDIKEKFKGQICEHVNLQRIIINNPIELAYSLALINTKNRYSVTPPWVLKKFPEVGSVFYLLRNKPCLQGCIYCNEALDAKKGLKRFFGFDSFRTFAGEPLQEKAVKAAIDNKSLLAVFPTGGGKSITFQVPALMSGLTAKGLTVVISPLQSLMKDQVDNLEQINITEAVTINGLLDPIERAKAFERVENGQASLLYVSPESLRSRSIEKLLLERNVVRFVIDEAHCFSVWGQDFRVDYMYIADFIKELQTKKQLGETIPVSCFTATAKQKVIEDIRSYFKNKLDLDLVLFTSNMTRTNLTYKVFEKNGDEEKYNALRNLIEEKKCPTIIYVSRTRRAYELAKRLSSDGYCSKPYHGKMNKQEKTENQDAFIRGEVTIMVATSAFGMGVDKKDVGMVIHYEISDSLENYVQEAGRAGRDERISADCYVLYNDEDLNKHFILLNQTKLSFQEIQQIWKAIKDITRIRMKVSQSALDIARKAGWDDGINDIETRVTSAIYALEEAGYIKRGQNMPRVYADGILCRNAQEAINRINYSKYFNENEKTKAIRIIKKLISSKSRISASKDELAEARVDYISDHLGISRDEVIHIINLLREERILGDSKDISAFIRRKEVKNKSANILKSFWHLERYLLQELKEEEHIINLKELNEKAEEAGIKDVTPQKIKTLLNIWSIKNLIKRQTSEYSKNHLIVQLQEKKYKLKDKLEKRFELCRFILNYLYELSSNQEINEETGKEEVLVEFSVIELMDGFNRHMQLLGTNTCAKEIEDALFYLSRIDALKIEGGFLVIYNKLTIERIEKDSKRRYKLEDYQKLDQFYQNKIQQIHIVGEYARQMIEDYKSALQFVDDYFRLNYSAFLAKYFKGSRTEDIKRNITPAKFRQLFGELSPTQLKIINDKSSKNIVVAAGPGSGKTKILVHKLASLILMEDVKHDQLLMLTFSRAAATEFKKRLIKLIGNAALFIEIKTFHSFCFDLLGKVGNIEKSVEIIGKAIQGIQNGEVEAGSITKTVLVLDEAQDMNNIEFELVKTLMMHNEEMRVIAVGDDDQNIFEFRGASSMYMEQLIHEHKAAFYELVENFRSKPNIVDYTNQFARRIPGRLKHTPVISVRKEPGYMKLVKYKSSNLSVPLVEDVLSARLSGSTCILTKTNEEAHLVMGLLLKCGLPAKLIQSNEGFNLYNLSEIRFFLSNLNTDENVHKYSEDIWEQAKKSLFDKFRDSSSIEFCMRLIRDFESTNPKDRYKSDLEMFIRETRLEDLYSESIETVYVSTIHKAKGKEFCNVFLMLYQFSPNTPEAMRQIYVAMTRAKDHLSIHYNGSFLDNIRTNGLITQKDENNYSQQKQLVLQLSYKDIVLDSCLSCQPAIKHLICGEALLVEEYYCKNTMGQHVLKFSKLFQGKLQEMKERGYTTVSAKVRFVVYWQKECAEEEIMVVLPDLTLEKREELR